MKNVNVREDNFEKDTFLVEQIMQDYDNPNTGEDKLTFKSQNPLNSVK